MKTSFPVVVVLLLAFLVAPLAAQELSSNQASATGPQSGQPATSDAAAGAQTLQPGAVITAQNWRNYTSFMPDGMVSLFQGKYYWKMPPDARIEVGATVVRPLPKNYLAATERYSGQVAIVTLPSGGLTLKNYRGGEPFPNPAEPHKGWKILTDVWYRYFPHLTVDSYGTACGQNSYGNISCTADELVTHQLSYNTDPGVPETIPGTQDEFFAEW
ncbi:MAG: DUF1329 domain-containing protein, partial [Candidatus Binataceae bacterium]